MKITEITEAPFGQFAKTVGRAATGAAWRQTKDVTRGVAGKMGFAGQAEKQRLQRIAGGVAKNFARYIAQQGLDQDSVALRNYLTDLGFNPADIKITSGGTAIIETERGAKANASDGDTYTFQGQQWTNDKTGRVATKPIASELESKPVNRNELFKTIADTIQTAMRNKRVPKTIEKFTKI